MPKSFYIKLLANSRFVILPLEKSYYATGQIALLEAMAMGKAVIVSRTAGTVDYIEDWKTGIFFNSEDVNDLRKKMEYLYENPEEILRIGRNARQVIEEKFNEKNMVDNILRIVRKCASISHDSS